MEQPSPVSSTLQLMAFRARTPARVLANRAGTGYCTDTSLALRGDHAFARDAVRTEIDLDRDLGRETVDRFGLFLVQSMARDKDDYLRRPDRGRKLNDDAKGHLIANCPKGVDLQIVIGDGLSTTAVAAQAPGLLPNLFQRAAQRGWVMGQPFVVRYCRVGVLNDIGELLDPAVVVLLIGERPGLATAESLSAYMAYRPRAGHTDAQRNLISNIHARGIAVEEAVKRIIDLAAQMREVQQSGVAVKERIYATGLPQIQ